MSQLEPSGLKIDDIVRQVIAALREQGVAIAEEGSGRSPPSSTGGGDLSVSASAPKEESASAQVNSSPASSAEAHEVRKATGTIVTNRQAEDASSVREASTPSRPFPPVGSPTVAVDDGRCVLWKRVITLADIAALLPSTREIVVPPRAVISPAVQDELAERSIRVVFAEDHAPQTSAACGVPQEIDQLYVEVVSRRLEVATIVEPLRREGIRVSAARGECLVTASQRLAEQLASGKAAGVILTRHPPLAVCLANRHKALRATWAFSMSELLEHVAEIGANVLVLDFRKLSVWQMVQLMARFVRLGQQQPPWQELLPAGL